VIVADASAIVELLLHSSRSEPIHRHAAHDQPLHVPHLADIEVLHALRRWAITGRLPADQLAARWQTYPMLAIVRHDHGPLLARAWELRGAFSAYDATYVALAEILDAPLITADRRLARAAAGLVDVVPALS
jgi:predicted nucleic acid-binding protein